MFISKGFDESEKQIASTKVLREKNFDTDLQIGKTIDRTYVSRNKQKLNLNMDD